MDAIRLREAAKRDYRDPVLFLRRLRLIEERMAGISVAPEVRNLRTNRLKEWREARLGALFCIGIGERIGHKVLLSKGEFEDADFLATWVAEDVQHFAPVQIKELVPEERNASATFDALVHGLTKYTGTKDLSILVHVNRRTHFDPTLLQLPSQLPIAALWVLACLSPDQSQWAIWGNLLEESEGTKFAYPT
ncbi:MAG: hypothetical protein KIT63_08250 [Rhodoferax sp.]|nr:hypothetical protein [Rhodoferax sp.]